MTCAHLPVHGAHMVGNEFNQNMVAFANSMTFQAGILSNGKVLYVNLIFSFAVLMYHSISLTCLSCPVSSSVISRSAISPLRDSNSPSMRTLLIMKPASLYICQTCSIPLSIFSILKLGMASIVPNLMFQEIVIKNGILFINMTSAQVTF